MRDAFTQLGVLATAFHLPAASGLGALAPVECVLQALVDAGFDIDQAGRALTLITETAYAAGRAAVLRRPESSPPQRARGGRRLGECGQRRIFPLLRQVVAASVDHGHDAAQFEFDVAVVIAGLERVLASGSSDRRQC